MLTMERFTKQGFWESLRERPVASGAPGSLREPPESRQRLWEKLRERLGTSGSVQELRGAFGVEAEAPGKGPGEAPGKVPGASGSILEPQGASGAESERQESSQRATSRVFRFFSGFARTLE